MDVDQSTRIREWKRPGSRYSPRVRYLLLFAVLLVACSSPRAPSLPDGQEKERCGIAEDITRKCAFPLECKRVPIGTISPEEAERGMSGENGGCGGVAGKQCAKGLVCEVPDRDVMVADAMGTCRQEWQCHKKE